MFFKSVLVHFLYMFHYVYVPKLIAIAVSLAEKNGSLCYPSMHIKIEIQDDIL